MRSRCGADVHTDHILSKKRKKSRKKAAMNAYKWSFSLYINARTVCAIEFQAFSRVKMPRKINEAMERSGT